MAPLTEIAKILCAGAHGSGQIPCIYPPPDEISVGRPMWFVAVGAGENISTTGAIGRFDIQATIHVPLTVFISR